MLAMVLALSLVACNRDRECKKDDDCAALYPCTDGMTCERGTCEGGTPAPPACGTAECGVDACGNPCGTCAGADEVCDATHQCVQGLTVLKGFVCPDDPAEVVLSEVQGVGTLVLVPDGRDCQGRLVLRTATGDVPLSSDASGYASAVGRTFPSGSRLVCTSDVRHHLHPDAAADASLPRVHVTDAIVLSCAAYDGSTWTPLATVVEPDGAWAAWTRGSIVEEAPNRWRVPFARDFTFQALNLTNRGRPATDGTYEVVVERRGDALVVVEPPVQVSSAVVQQEWMTSGQWVPSEAEKAAGSEYIDYSDGDCPPPNGCGTSPPE